jgi:hypothetical protein
VIIASVLAAVEASCEQRSNFAPAILNIGNIFSVSDLCSLSLDCPIALDSTSRTRLAQLTQKMDHQNARSGDFRSIVLTTVLWQGRARVLESFSITIFIVFYSIIPHIPLMLSRFRAALSRVLVPRACSVYGYAPRLTSSLAVTGSGPLPSGSSAMLSSNGASSIEQRTVTDMNSVMPVEFGKQFVDEWIKLYPLVKEAVDKWTDADQVCERVVKLRSDISIAITV